VPTWDLAPGDAVAMRLAEAPGLWGPWQGAVLDSDGFSAVTMEAEPATAHGLRLLVCSSGEERPDLFCLPEGCDLPICPDARSDELGVLARVNILLFGDSNLNLCPINRHESAYHQWADSLRLHCRLCPVEVGAGQIIPTIRNEA